MVFDLFLLQLLRLHITRNFTERIRSSAWLSFATETEEKTIGRKLIKFIDFIGFNESREWFLCSLEISQQQSSAVTQRRAHSTPFSNYIMILYGYC